MYGTEMTPMETMGDVYHRLANHAQVGAAVKGFVKVICPLLSPWRGFAFHHPESCNKLSISRCCTILQAVDVTAANAMRVMREYPLARVIFFLYSIFIHLFVYILIQRLQNRLLLADESGNDPGMP